MLGNKEYTGNRRIIEVQVRLDDGTRMQGNLILTGQRSFGEFVNSGPTFFEFHKLDGTITWLALTSVAQIWEHQVPDATQLEDAIPKDRRFNPYEILGVNENADMREVHRAYVRLARLYHPDRYNAVGLPSEMQGYVQDMSKRINAAYTELENLLKGPSSHATAS